MCIRDSHRYTSQQGRAGPIYGHDDTYEGLGIFFDTFEDAENGTAEPFVVAMMNYGKPIGEGDTPDYYDNQVGRLSDAKRLGRRRRLSHARSVQHSSLTLSAPHLS